MEVIINSKENKNCAVKEELFIDYSIYGSAMNSIVSYKVEYRIDKKILCLYWDNVEIRSMNM